MKVEVTKEFKWAPDGNHVVTVPAGKEVDGRAAEVAIQLGCARESKAQSAAPKNKAEPKAPKNKAK